jgi:hypothetical protein
MFQGGYIFRAGILPWRFSCGSKMTLRPETASVEILLHGRIDPQPADRHDVNVMAIPAKSVETD